jgi:hypothetical protein
MPKHAWEDLDAFFNADEFATTVTLRLQSGVVRHFNAVFDDPYLNAELGEYELDTNRPRLTCKESDVLGVTRGDLVEIDGKTYDVLTGAQPDGTGMAMLEMALQA